MTPRERAIAWRHAEIAEICDRVQAWEHGVVAVATDIPGFWQFNQVRVEDVPDLDAAELAAVTDELLAGFAHRFLEIDDQEYAERLRPSFEALGWIVNRGVVMHLAGEPWEVTARVHDASEDDVRAMRREWHLSERWSGGSEQAVADFIAAEDTLNARRSTRLLVTDGPNGAAAGYVRIRAGEGAGEVLEAYVRRDHRGSGLGGALVAAGAAALREGGAADVYIVADDEDRPKRLYARIGFEPVRIAHELIRVPPA
jgi:ribosomal protein S18 acetylase RimI-like enzyme